jgi:hypothetical protein
MNLELSFDRLYNKGLSHDVTAVPLLDQECTKLGDTYGAGMRLRRQQRWRQRGRGDGNIKIWLWLCCAPSRL